MKTELTEKQRHGVIAFNIGLICLATALFGWVGLGLSFMTLGILTYHEGKKSSEAANDSKLH